MGWGIAVGDGFCARVDSVRKAAVAAHAVGEELRERAGTLLGEGTGDPGHAGLAQEMTAFAERLRGLAAGFADEGASVGDRLDATAEAYERVDGAAAARFAAWLG